MKKLFSEKNRWLITDVFLACYVVAELLFEHSTISRVFLVLFCASMIGILILKKELYFDWFFPFYAGLAVWGAFCSLAGFAMDKGIAMDMVLTIVINLVYLFILYQYFMLRDDLEQPFRFFMLAAVASLIGLIIISWPDVLTRRLGEEAGYMPNVISTLFETAYAFALYLFMKKKKWYDAALLLLFFVSILLTASRRGIASAAFITIVYVLWINRKHFWKTILILFGIAAVGCVLCLVVPKLKELAWDRMVKGIKAIFTFNTSVQEDGSARLRAFFLREALPQIKEHPFTGIGMDCFYTIEQRGTYSHNNYIELLVSGGIPALILFYIPVVRTLIRGLKGSGRSDGAKMAVCLVIRLLITGLMVVSYYERPELLILVVAMALVERANGKKPLLLRKKEKPGVSVLSEQNPET